MAYCRITLKTLTKKEQEKGYSRVGIMALTQQKSFNFILPFSRNEFADVPRIQKGMSISGYQPKIGLTIQDNRFYQVHQRGQFILKPSPAEYPYLAENEHATMQLMRTLGFEVPENGLVAFQPSQNTQENQPLEYAYVVRRFDRDLSGNPIHQEQLDGAMGICEKYGKTGVDNEQYVSYEQAVKFILKHTGDNLKLKQTLFRIIIYAYLLGNNDLHLRNFSLLHTKANEIKLSPLYDFVSVVPYPEIFNSAILALPLLAKEEGGKELAHGFNTQYGEYIGQDFVEFGENIGLTRKLILERLLPNIQQEQNIVMDIYQRAFIPEQDKITILKIYQKRLRLLSLISEPTL